MKHSLLSIFLVLFATSHSRDALMNLHIYANESAIALPFPSIHFSAVIFELQQDDLITTEDRKNLSDISAVVSVQKRKSPDVMCRTADILERHGFVEDTKSLQGNQAV